MYNITYDDTHVCDETLPHYIPREYYFFSFQDEYYGKYIEI